MTQQHDDVLQANVKLHSRLAADYQRIEPQFRPQNVSRVQKILGPLIEQHHVRSVLDLGCGTGFMISNLKGKVDRIFGVDATQAMLDQVDISGSTQITLQQGDATSFTAEGSVFDMVSAYSVLHHLYDIKPLLETAYRHLAPGGVFYADQEPNFYFWNALSDLKRDGDYDPVVKREIEMVNFKDEDIEREFGVSREVFNQAEFGKNIKGGFREEELVDLLTEVGFKNCKVFYWWYIGQAYLVNCEEYEASKRDEYAAIVDRVLQKTMPISRPMYKYLGMMAEK